MHVVVWSSTGVCASTGAWRYIWSINVYVPKEKQHPSPAINCILVGVELLESLLHSSWDANWLDLVQVFCRGPQLPWVPERNGHVISRRQHFTASLQPIALTFSQHLL